MIICNKCGKQLNDDSGFCTACGAPAIKEEAVVYQTQPFYETPPAFIQPMMNQGRNTFVNSYLGVAVLAAFFIGLLVLGIVGDPNGYLFDPRGLGFLFIQICILGPIAFATVLSTRAKGPDFSIGAVMGLSSAIIGLISYSNGSPVLSIVMALLACAVIGILNGALITYLRTPAIIVTIVTGLIARSVANVILDGQTLPVNDTIGQIANYRVGELSLGGMIILVVTFVAAFLMIMFTKLGVPTYKRDKRPMLSYMFAYMASALMASVAGIFLASRLGAASPLAGTGFETFIVFVFACVVGSRVMDNRFAPAVYALAPVLFFSIFQFILSISGVDVFWQTVYGGILAVVFIAVAFVSRRFSSSYVDD